MREGKVKLLNSGAARRGGQRILAGMALAGLLVCAMLASHALVSLPARSSQAGRSVERRALQSGPYLYYVLKQPQGFVLARARAGANHQPLETPRVVASFGDDFGQTTADTIVSLQLSPDGRYMAIDGTRSDGEFVWIFDAQRLALTLQPASAGGTFLHWLPGSSETFLFRPMFPRGPDAPLNGGSWNPGLWEINALTGAITNIDIHVPSAWLVDAVPSPDGSQIVYSTCAGLGMGSDIWRIDVHGGRRVHLLQLSGDVHSVAGLFTWSPNGQTLATNAWPIVRRPFCPLASGS